MTNQYIKHEYSVPGKHIKPITFDISFMEKTNKQPVIIFCHGFKGFKDWGTHSLMAEHFARQNFVFIKMNFSHNGTTPENLSDISDLEAFGNNNFEIELDDLDVLMNWIEKEDNPFNTHFNKSELYLIGHSRGGGIVMLKAVEDSRVKKIAVWGSVNDFEKYMTLSDVETWRKDGVTYIENYRTGIKMPLYFQFYENYYKHEFRFDLKNRILELDKPILLLHGTHDETVPLKDAEWIYEQLDHSILVKVESANHSFGGMHPWNDDIMPENLSFAVEETIEFFNF